MQKSPSHKTKHFFALAIKLFIVIGCVYFIYLKLVKNEQFSVSDFLSKLTLNNVFSFKNCVVLFLFSFLNWLLEATKWNLLTSNITRVSFYQSIKQSLASLTVSLITPNRIGEYGAKALYFEKPYRKQIVGLNLIGNLHQLSATVFIGFLGICYFIHKQNIEIKYSRLLLFSGVLVAISLLILIGVRYFSFGKKMLKKAQTFISEIPIYLHTKTGMLSFFRFGVFSHQFYFLLMIFHIDISYLDAVTSISSMYLIASIIPMLSLFDVILKSSVAIWIFSFHFIDETTILGITMLMWVFNFVFPAIIGSYFVLTFDTQKLITAKE
jgi:hypothetical protein